MENNYIKLFIYWLLLFFVARILDIFVNIIEKLGFFTSNLISFALIIFGAYFFTKVNESDNKLK